MAPGRTLNIAITLSLAERLVGRVRACAAPSFRYSRPPHPRSSVFSALGEGKALGPRAAMCRAGARGTLPRADFLEAHNLHAPTPVFMPSLAAGIPTPLGLPLLRAGDLQRRGPGAILEVWESWAPWSWRKSNPRVLIFTCSFTCSQPLQTLFSHSGRFRVVTVPKRSPPLSLHRDSSLILKLSNFGSRPTGAPSNGESAFSKATNPSSEHPPI